MDMNANFIKKNKICILQIFLTSARTEKVFLKSIETFSLKYGVAKVRSSWQRHIFYSKRQIYFPFAIIPPGDAHEFASETCCLRSANSAQETDKTKIVLSFPIVVHFYDFIKHLIRFFPIQIIILTFVRLNIIYIKIC